MGYTPFGEYVRILRIKNHQVMGDMAKILEVSLPFLSAVENGKKNVPVGWLEKLSDFYSLTDSEKKELEDAIEASKMQIKLNASAVGSNQRRAALQFARSFDSMDDETALKIMELLNKKEGSKK